MMEEMYIHSENRFTKNNTNQNIQTQTCKRIIDEKAHVEQNDTAGPTTRKDRNMNTICYFV